MTLQTFDGVQADQMYREHILDHYKNPRNKGILKNALHQHENNPLCGDQIDMYMTIEDDKIKEVSFVSQGCAISQASASMLTESIKNKNIDEVAKMNQHTMKDLLGIDVTAMRVKCMMLPLKATKMIVLKQIGRENHD